MLLNNSGETNLFEMMSGIIHVLYGSAPPDPEPRLRDIFLRKIREESLDEAIGFYREKRETATDDYLFFRWPLRILASQMLKDGDIAGSIAIYRLNIETHPADAKSHEGLAEAFVRSGNSAAAIESLATSLELNGSNDYAAALLERLQRD